jgi:hypothetical protein
MPAREIMARAAYQGYTAYERIQYNRGLVSAPDRLRRALAPELGRRSDWRDVLVSREASGAFLAGFDASGGSRARMTKSYCAELDKARAIADSIARHEIEFFGRQFAFGARIDWHADPESGAQWPQVYHRDVPVSTRVFGDAKYVWELNRHQFLVDLAKIAFLDGSERHRLVLQDLVVDWQRAAPYGTGVPWACALEPAFRAWSWMFAYHFLRAAGPIDREFHLSWLTGFLDHGRFLHRHLESYTSPYNHLIGEASALFALGLLFPEFGEASAWVSRGRRVLESTVALQFHSDGGSVEQSTFYHHATLGFYLLAALLGRRNGAELSGTIWTTIERAIEFSAALVQPDGRVPSIGGADDGKPIRLEHVPFFDFRPYQAVGAVLFARGDFKHVAGRFWEDALWLLGTDGADAFAALRSEAPLPHAALRSSGYYVARNDWSSGADYLCFDCGPQAAGLRRDDVPSAAHGHADCLSVVVMLGGKNVLIDPGFYCYNGDPEWEVHFRRTRAHNTVTVDGADQARHVSKMAWARTYDARLEGWSADGRLAWVRGTHNGYTRSSDPVSHRRTAWLRPNGYVVLYDEICGTGSHDVEATFQFAPGTLRLDTGRAVLDDRFELWWMSAGPLHAQMFSGGDGPADGWMAPSLGVRHAAPRLALRGTLAGGRMVLVTLLVDRRRAICRGLDPHAREGILRATLEGEGWSDIVLASQTGTVVDHRIDSDAPLVALEVRGGLIEHAAQAGGTRIAFSAGTPADQPWTAMATPQHAL